MKKNEGTIDRVLRLLVGLGLISYAVFGGSAWGYIGVVPLLTGIIGLCPLYGILGMSTCGKCASTKTGGGCACGTKK